MPVDKLTLMKIKKAVQYILEISEIVGIVDYKNILCVLKSRLEQVY